MHPARPLVRRVGWRTRETEEERDYWAHCDKPEVRYFLEANPGYGEGHGLVTLVPLTQRNLLSTARSLISLAPREQHSLEAGTRLFVLSSTVGFEHEGLVMTQHGSTELEARRPLRVKAREATRLVVLKQEAAPRYEKDAPPRLAAA